MIKAQEYLKEIQKLTYKIECKALEKLQMKSIAKRLRTSSFGERVQSTPNPHRMEDAIIDSIDAELEYDSEISELVKKRKEMIRIIEQLKPDEYKLLHLVYVQNFPLKEAAFKMKDGSGQSRSYSWATTTHGRALQHVQRILDESEKGVI